MTSMSCLRIRENAAVTRPPAIAAAVDLVQAVPRPTLERLLTREPVND
jgi:hypothetical protein